MGSSDRTLSGDGTLSGPSPGRRVSRRAFGRSMAAATAAGTLGTALWSPAAEALTTNAAARAMPHGGAFADAMADSVNADSLKAGSVKADTAKVTPIRIGSNENPYGLGPAALAAVQASCGEANRYPFSAITQLSARVAQLHDVPEASILMSPGSGDILRAATLAFTASTRALVTAAPTFEAPGRVAEMIGAPVRELPVLPSGSLDLDGMASKADGAGLFFICNPNNPTGGLNPDDAVRAFIARVRKAAPEAVVLVDEAYFEFVDDPAYATAIPLTRTDPKVIVSRTFSKIHGMAGLRVGYAIGHPATLAAMRRAMGNGTLSGLSASTALASLGDAAHLKRQVALNAETRASTRAAFEKAGFSVLPSQANFVMVDIKRPAAAFQAQCREAGVQIARPFPPLDTYARVSIGTAEEMQRALAIMLPLLRMPASAVAARFAPDYQSSPFRPFQPLEPIEWTYMC